MRRIHTAVLLLLTAGLFLLPALSASAQDWPQFRGPDTTSSSLRDDLPVEWSVETGAGIAWQADLPGNGVSTPIVVGDRVIVTAASGADNDRLHVLAFDARSGDKLWQRQFWATGRTQVYRTSSVAAGTPASDGARVFALYSSNDLVALDLEGNLLWIRSLTQQHPKLGNDIGMASSPVFVPTGGGSDNSGGGGVVVAQCESKTASFLAAFDPQTGATLWEVTRPEESNWTSPIAVGEGVLAQSREKFTMYAAATGDVLWEESADCASISSPVLAGDTLLVPADGVLALTASSDAAPEVRWSASRVKPGSPSVAVGGGVLYAIARGGIMTAASLDTGEPLWKQRLGGTFWATPVVTPSRVYAANQGGAVFVVSTDGGEVLAENKMGADLYGSPVAAAGGLFLRSNETLWKIATPLQASRQP